MHLTHRLFAGIAVPPDVARLVTRACRPLTGLPVRWQRPENLYITVAFLGHVDDAALPELMEDLRDAVAAHQAHEIVFDRIAPGPDAARPKMFWLSGEAPVAAAALRSDVTRVTAPLHEGFALWHPHITLGRIRQAAWRAAVTADTEISRSTRIVIPVDTVTLFESVTEPVVGMTYVPLARFPLA